MKVLPALFIICCFLFIACSPTTGTRSKKSAKTRLAITPADTMIQKQSTGIDFFARGNDPVSWSIEMDFDNSYTFKASDGTSTNAPAVISTKMLGPERDSYLTKSETDLVNVMIYNTACADNLNAIISSVKVEVIINNKRYSGCGDYLYDYRINDVWILEYIDNKKQESSGYKKGLPFLEFNLAKNKMVGNNGCNDIGSSIEVQGNRIKFAPFTGKKMACSNPEVENIFTTFLSNQLVDYYIKDGKLILYLINDSKLTFKKAD